MYEALGMGWVYAITKVPILGAMANFIYGIWADLRLRLTGRPNLDTVIKQRQEKTRVVTMKGVVGWIE